MGLKFIGNMFLYLIWDCLFVYEINVYGESYCF